MALSERIRIACPTCEFYRCILDVSADNCPACSGTGRDADAERRLGELADRLPIISGDLRAAGLRGAADHLDALAAALTSD